MNMRYLARETVELVLNEGSDLEDFPDSGSEENIFDSGEEFVPVDLEADLRDSDNNIFIFIIGIRATSRLKLFFIFCIWTIPTLLLGQRKVYDIMLWFINLTSIHSKLSKNVYVYCIIPSSLFTTIFFLNGQKQCVYSWAGRTILWCLERVKCLLLIAGMFLNFTKWLALVLEGLL